MLSMVFGMARVVKNYGAVALQGACHASSHWMLASPLSWQCRPYHPLPREETEAQRGDVTF